MTGPADVALEVMDALRLRLTTRLADTPGGTPCFSGMYPGTLTVADWCGCTTSRDGSVTSCGMAAVRLDRIYAYDRFPQQASGAVPCDAPLAAVIELSTYRCRPVGTGREGPSAAQLAQAVIVQNGDIGAMHYALTCTPALSDRDHALGQWTPRDGGDCGGGYWPVTVALQRR